MKILIIGGVSAGTSAAIGARRNSEDAQITIYDRDVDFNHAAYATHYVIGGVVESLDQLTPTTSDWFKQRHNIDVHMNHDIQSIDHENKIVYGINLTTNEEFQDSYDKLIFATGSSATVPPAFKGNHFSNVFTVKNVQGGRELQECIDREKPENVVVVGGGYIGLGVSEQLTNIGMNVSTLEFLKYPMAQLDSDISVHIQDILEQNGVDFYGNDGVVELVSENGRLTKVITDRNKEYTADLFIVATGVRPNTELAQTIGVELGESGAIKVNEKLQTNIPDVFAVGDVAEAYHVITKEPLYLPLATTAVKMGRIAGDYITGGSLRFNGVLGTSVVRLFGQTIASTGLTEKAARAKGLNISVLTNSNLSRLKFMGGEDILIKAIANQDSEEIVGVQIIGAEGVDRLIDVFATAMTFRAKVSELFQLDMAFTPPISTPVDPVMFTGMTLFHAIHDAPLLTAEELNEVIQEEREFLLVDLREESEYKKTHLKEAVNIPMDYFRDFLEEMSKHPVGQQINHLKRNQKIIFYSDTGENGYLAQKTLLNKGYEKVYNLSGGFVNYTTLHHDKLV